MHTLVEKNGHTDILFSNNQTMCHKFHNGTVISV
jgi:hypothetical protein